MTSTRYGLILVVLVRAVLAEDGARLRELVRVLSGPDRDASLEAAAELRRHGAKVAPLLVEMLAEKDEVTFEAVSDVLAGLWRDSGGYVRAGVGHKNPAIRLGCALVLQRVARSRGETVPEEVVAVLTEGLGSPDRSLLALEALAQEGLAVDAALPLMRRLIAGPDEEMRDVAWRSYCGYGSKADADIAFLGGLARGSDKAVARDAMRALGHLGPAAVPEIRRAAEAEDEEIAAAAVKAAGFQGDAARELIPLLIRMHRRQKSVPDLLSLEALIDIGPDDERVRAVLRDEIRAGGRRAAEVARLVGGVRIVSREKVVPRSERFHAELRMLLEADAAGTRAAAAFALAESGVDLERALDTLVVAAEEYGERQRYEREMTIRTLCSLGPAAAAAAPRLIALAARVPEARASIANGLPQMGRAAMPALVEALAAGGEARSVALRCIEEFGPLARDAQDALRALAAEEGMGETLARITAAMQVYRPWPSNQLLIDGLRHESADVRALAAGHYARGGGSGDRQEREFLLELLRVSTADTLESVRALAARSYWAMTGDADSVLPLMRAFARSADPRVRATVCAAASAVAGRGRDVPPGIRGSLLDLMFGDASEEVRRAAGEALAAAGFPDDGADRTILALRGSDRRTRAYGALAAAHYPDAAPQTVPLLAAMLADADGRLVQAALASIRELGPRARAALPRLEAMRDRAKDEASRELLVQVIRSVGG